MLVWCSRPAARASRSEPRGGRRAGRERRQDLERDPAAQRQLDRLVDDPHPAPPDFADDLEAGDRGQRRGGRSARLGLASFIGIGALIPAEHDRPPVLQPVQRVPIARPWRLGGLAGPVDRGRQLVERPLAVLAILDVGLDPSRVRSRRAVPRGAAPAGPSAGRRSSPRLLGLRCHRALVPRRGLQDGGLLEALGLLPQHPQDARLGLEHGGRRSSPVATRPRRRRGTRRPSARTPSQVRGWTRPRTRRLASSSNSRSNCSSRRRTRSSRASRRFRASSVSDWPLAGSGRRTSRLSRQAFFATVRSQERKLPDAS